MFELVIKIGVSVLQNIAQLMIGTVLAVIFYALLNRKMEYFKNNRVKDRVLILISSLLGAVLPLDTFGVLPIVLVLLQLGLKVYIVMPILFSNTLFNMLIPFNDPSFVWRSGYEQLILAVVLGAVTGLLVKAVNGKKDVFKIKAVSRGLERPIKCTTFLASIHNNITTMGIFLIVGSILNVLFNEYVIFNVTEAVFSHSKTAFITRFFGRYNIVHPLFLLGIGIVYALMNFTKLAGLLVVVKPKSIMMYLMFCGLCACLLSLSIFIK